MNFLHPIGLYSDMQRQSLNQVKQAHMQTELVWHHWHHWYHLPHPSSLVSYTVSYIGIKASALTAVGHVCRAQQTNSLLNFCVKRLSCNKSFAKESAHQGVRGFMYKQSQQSNCPRRSSCQSGHSYPNVLSYKAGVWSAFRVRTTCRPRRCELYQGP